YSKDSLDVKVSSENICDSQDILNSKNETSKDILASYLKPEDKYKSEDILKNYLVPENKISEDVLASYLELES
ncbi:6832_t:CDS:1, partial [Diversispora eburnea]